MAYKKIFTESEEDYQKKFIVNNMNLADEYDIRSLYDILINKKFRKDTDYFLDIERGEYKVSSLKFSVPQKDLSYEELLNTFNNFIKGHDLSDKELKEKDNFHVLNDWYYIRQEKKDVILMKLDGLSSLIHLLDYIINNNFEKDLARANKIMDENGISYFKKFVKNLLVKGLEPLVLTVLKNRKIILKGLSNKQYEELERLIKLVRGEK